jgi:hypothetical protein
VDLQNL